ncbi:hypothetical protein SEUCBS139899_007847 [Sporothrix eucalyptigena]|uniref:Major facilitator superfamily (MFS) profile domain-containing protein n=1 Tax=Sporothrix eucalyptigena TaxID=1812306 RepID=A0ABP0C971_9PEZI
MANRLTQFVRARTQHVNRRLLYSVVLISISSMNYGFDNQAFSTTQAMTPFTRRFGEYNETTKAYYFPSYWLSLFDSLNYITFGFGVLFGSFVSARFGRRWCMCGMSAYALVTATLCVTAQNKQQIMAARILNYFYVGMELSVVPVFQSEIVPASFRGFAVGSYQLSLTVGGVVINSVCYGTSLHYPNDDRAWRIPLGLFYVVPSIILAGIWFVPESPRWLLQQDRVDEARRALVLFRENANVTDADIDREFAEIQFQLQRESETGRFRELFQGINLRRTLIVAAVNFFQQATGQAFVSQYGAIYVKSLDTLNPSLFAVMNSALAAGVMVLMLLGSDRFGRRTILFLANGLMLCALLSMAGIGTQATLDRASKTGVMALMTVFGVAFGMGWGPMTWVVTTEIAALRLRDQTVRVGFLVNIVFNFAVNFCIPYLVFSDYANLGSKVGFIFGAIVFLALLFIYFFLPECKGKSLEQIDHLFNARVPMRQFGKIPAASVLQIEMDKSNKDAEIALEHVPTAV